MSRGPDIGMLLVRALYRDSVANGCPMKIVTSDCVRWASATFVGARHAMKWTALPSPALDAWLAELPEAEFEMRGHLLADIDVIAITRTATSVGIEFEALTVEALDA
ncbi:hypothetical protein [Sphingomonas sp. GB1N7]|uniref:hypothetical protein n=1 Tax=Parasphingomonas caseinilytica TaxID=3096158 RepID=UPI002FC92BCD